MRDDGQPGEAASAMGQTGSIEADANQALGIGFACLLREEKMISHRVGLVSPLKGLVLAWSTHVSPLASRLFSPSAECDDGLGNAIRDVNLSISRVGHRIKSWQNSPGKREEGSN